MRWRIAHWTASETVTPPGSAMLFQARGDVDAVAVDRAVALLDHVAEMDADPKLHPAVGATSAERRPSSAWIASAEPPRHWRSRRSPGPSRRPCRSPGRAGRRSSSGTPRAQHRARRRCRLRRSSSGASNRPRRPSGSRPGAAASRSRSRGLRSKKCRSNTSSSAPIAMPRPRVAAHCSRMRSRRNVAIRLQCAARVAMFSSQRRRSRFRLPSPVCLRLAPASRAAGR